MDASSLLSGSGPISAPYGSWLSPITSDLIVAATINIADVLMDGDAIYWIEGRPQEAGRYVLVRNVPDAAPVDVTPPPFNARTRVQEYGGGGITSTGAASGTFRTRT